VKKTTWFIFLTLLLLIPACRPEPAEYTLGVLSAENAVNLSAGIVSLGVEQNVAYALAQAARTNQFDQNLQPESALTDDVQVAVRGLVEHKDTPALALVGATSNAASTRMAALANFFNLPLVIPSALGDNLLPSNNLWAFRLSAPGSAHAEYVFGNLLTRPSVQALTTDDKFAPTLKIAILYEQNTFGESSAVATAQAAMAQEIEIDFYGHFPPDAPDRNRLVQVFTAMQEAKVHLVYIIANNPDSARFIIQQARAFFLAGEEPILLGQSGAFASREFLTSPEAAGVYIIRQQIVTDRCPDEIETLAQAQAYAAVQLLNLSFEQARDRLPVNTTPSIADAREHLRDALKGSNFNLPCLGATSFDNSGQNKNLNFEFLFAASDTPRLISPDQFIEQVTIQLNRSAFD
jgi:ABC-type branched-subunit amino acid transport system substrate-binding protein